MSVYKLSDGNTILASQDFISENYPDAVEVIIPPTKDELNAPILAELAEIDKQSSSARAIRDIALGQLDWIRALENKAVDLRAKLIK